MSGISAKTGDEQAGGDEGDMPSPFRTSGTKNAKSISRMATMHGAERVSFQVPGGEKPDPSTRTLVIKGTKGSGKTVLPSGLPVDDGYIYYVSLDGATRASLENFYRETPGYSIKELADRVRIYDVVSKQGNFPGFDTNLLYTAEVVVGNIMAALEQIEADEDGDVIVLDMFEALHEDVGPAYARFKAGLSPTGGKLRIQDWQNRKQVVSLIENKLRHIAENWAVISGYGKEEKLVRKDVADGDEMKTEFVKEVVQPRWYETYQKPYLATIDTKKVFREEGDSVAREGDAGREFWAFVEDDRVGVFGTGKRYNLTGHNLGIFFDGGERQLQEIMVPEGAIADAVDGEAEDE